MRKDKVRAYELRRQEKSYSEISRTLGISKGTLAGWFKEEEWSQGIRDKLGSKTSLSSIKNLAHVQKVNRARWSGIYQTYREAAELEFENLKSDPLFIAGTMLYWAEGNKSTKYSQVKFSSSDPKMIATFYLFLKKCLKVPNEKIKASLLLYPDLKDEMQKSFWSKATGIPLRQFSNSVYITGKHPNRRLSYGVCNICLNSREWKEKILTWIDLCNKNLS